MTSSSSRASPTLIEENYLNVGAFIEQRLQVVSGAGACDPTSNDRNTLRCFRHGIEFTAQLFDIEKYVSNFQKFDSDPSKRASIKLRTHKYL